MYKNAKLFLLSCIIILLLCSCRHYEEPSSDDIIETYTPQSNSTETTENSSDTSTDVQENAIILDEPTSNTPSADEQTDDISVCPDCNGEGRLGSCDNCQGTGYDKKAKQICVKCLHTGKKRCERCDGYGMIDSNGNGTSGNTYSGSPSVTTPDVNTYSHHSSECWFCHGDGLCDNCGGSGRYTYNPDFAGDSCRTCDGTGRCPGCNGKGIVN